MIICVCHRVSDRDIARAALAGCASSDELRFALGVATRCGKCHADARTTFDKHAAAAASPGSVSAGRTDRIHAEPARIAVHPRGETTYVAA